MKGFEEIVEERIRAGMLRGDFANLPGAGKPLNFDDDALVPEDQRMAMHVLKNAGFVPPEVQQLGEAQRLLALCEEAPAGSAGRRSAMRRLEVLVAQIEQAGMAEVSRAMLVRYREALLERLDREGEKKE